ncbi:MAG: SMP-30/gluconolactonase/LRE family protein [Pontiellaceae bacterium]|nr:SMP-30/gluconolactonase/LRE family protein [Pontiellaceae bacterium]
MLLSIGRLSAQVTAPGATLTKLPGSYSFTEGPTADAEGNVYFTDHLNNRILKWNAAAGTVAEWMKPAGRANGLMLTPEGDLLAAADEHNQLWSISPDKTVTVLVENFGGKLLNGPNDVWKTEKGHIYFTDPLYAREYWDRNPAMQQPGQYVYLIAAGSTEPIAILTDLNQPNGLIESADGETLFVADIGDEKTYAYDIQDDGTLMNKRLFCSKGSDGMTIDSQGNVYLTGSGGVTVFNQSGTQIQRISVSSQWSWTSNVTFAGAERDLLFITSGSSIYSIKMSVKGVIRVTSPITAEEYRLVGGIVGGTNLSLSVADSVPEHEYQIWTTESLMDADWQPVGESLSGSGANLLFILPLDAQATNQFFKVEIQQQ